METLELNAAFLVDDRQQQLVFVKELVERLQTVEKRCVALEGWRERHLANLNRGTQRPVADSPQLEVRTGGLDLLGHGERADGLLAELVAEDYLAEQEGDVEDSLVHQIAAAVSEHKLCVAGD
jgi:hypothetical protein